ncbi:Peptide methionine sulfoxide reductase MsrA [Paraburkholderia tropica]|uniref:peptide-methionine (S)-S-oxide reductase MsrA n=1 Tax=Paraburkholderia tropica TaxID=92647 RepID=UPI001CB6752F|nr:Peptide methionine sulfoxide reductase MsrA [Paraburkholderia tropica]
MNIVNPLFMKSSKLARYGAVAIAVVAVALWQRSAHSDERAVSIPAPLQDEPANGVHSETAVVSGGCFWGVQGVFQHVRGVTQVASGYTGGAADTAQYERVSDGDTGHAESVRITFDPTVISYGKILQVFFSVAHDPTELDYQGPDHGTQYRSAIFPMNPQQRNVAKAYIAQLQGAHVFSSPIVTRIETFKGFYNAEDYHQNFLALHPDYPYIAINDMPKVNALKNLFPALYRPQPVLFQTVARTGS